MKKYSSTTYDRIHLLIDKAHQSVSFDTSQNLQNYKELLQLSLDASYLYGQAVAHIYLAQGYQILESSELYKYHMDNAYAIAKRKDYFDVLITYYNVEGLSSWEQGDYVNTIDAYLKGVQIAISINDKKSCSVFYNNIAEIFFDTKEYDMAAQFYLQSLVSLEDSEHSNVNMYRKITMANLMRLTCLKNDDENAKKYYYQFQEIHYEDDMLTLISLEMDVRYLLIDKQEDKALEKLKLLIKQLDESSVEALLLKSEYIYLLDMCMDLNQLVLARFLLDKMDVLYQDENQNITLYMQKKHIQLSRLEGVDDDLLYATFYAKTQAYESQDKVATGESLKSFMSLYNAEKEQKKILDEQRNLEVESKHDTLTPVYNRRYFSKLISKHLQEGTLHSIGYIMIDVDKFKEYNDYYGHMQGDTILKEVASILKSNIFKNAFVARYGGDEFACLFLDYTEEDMIAYVEKVQNEIESKHIEHRKNMNGQVVTLSFGIYCSLSCADEDESTLSKKADDALYEAKRKGRNTYVVYRKEACMVAEENTDEINSKFLTWDINFVKEQYERLKTSDEKYALIQLNIKNFRFYNTKYGNQKGNEILALIFNAIYQTLGNDEYVTNSQADDFILLIKYEDAHSLMYTRMMKLVDILYRIDDEVIYRNIFYSVGMYLIEDKQTTFEEAINYANLCRKECSSLYKRCTSLEIYDLSFYQSYVDRLELENKTAEAYKNYEFTTFLQPKVDLKTDEIVGAEALLRWFDKDGKSIPLSQFLPILNQNGYIQLVDIDIFEEMCKLLEQRIKDNKKVVPISFNISKSYFYNDNLVKDYIKVFEKYDIPKHLIEIELMESISLDDTERMHQIVHDFREYGFTCLLDDFGNGYSSFTVLLNAPFDVVKMDRQFFMPNLKGDNALVIKTIVQLIHSLNMKVVAEGVEEDVHIQCLKECGCDYVQGYYYYHPMPLDAFYDLIEPK